MINDELGDGHGRRDSVSRLPFLILDKTVKRREVHYRVLHVWEWQRTGPRRPASVTTAKANKDAAKEHYKELG